MDETQISKIDINETHFDESVGEEFRVDLLTQARDKTLAAIEHSAALIVPGMGESDARAIVADALKRAGAAKSWHPAQVRFGENTLLPFGKPGRENVRLRDHDIFFLDIGPIFAAHEGDVGRSFAVGADVEMHRCCKDAREIWTEVANKWRAASVANGISGGDLYRAAENFAAARGWRLALEKANGHRIADFPHAARVRQSIQGLTRAPAPNRWILEIQIRHPTLAFGAFYEDLLS